jgi:hypothetical protein
MENKAFEEWHNNEYLGATLHEHNESIVSLMREAFKAGESHSEYVTADKCVELAAKEHLVDNVDCPEDMAYGCAIDCACDSIRHHFKLREAGYVHAED